MVTNLFVTVVQPDAVCFVPVRHNRAELRLIRLKQQLLGQTAVAVAKRVGSSSVAALAAGLTRRVSSALQLPKQESGGGASDGSSSSVNGGPGTTSRGRLGSKPENQA